MTEQQRLMLVLILIDVMDAVDELLSAKGQRKRFDGRTREVEKIANEISHRIDAQPR
jgi:hypothetical protein